MEAFAEMARASSTPFHGRHFIPDEDDNTCNVEIAFKKPEPIPEPVLLQPNQVNYITTMVNTLSCNSHSPKPVVTYFEFLETFNYLSTLYHV